MRLLYPCDPFDQRKPDPAYDPEVEVAEKLGLAYSVVNYEALVSSNNPLKAVQRVEQARKVATGIYRGWMLRPERYRELYEALETRGIRLINDPDAYVHTHHLPESYPLIEEYTPRTVWIKSGPFVRIDEVMALLRPFDSRPIVVKDYVKSRKHEWDEAFYIPSASDREAVERVVWRLVELQDEDLNEGLVFREFIEFEPLGKHPKSGIPLTREYRIFWLDGEPIYWTRYWEGADYGGQRPPIEQFREVAKTIKSRFFTMDIAKRLDGDWMIIELGDGQVAGLPDHADIREFYIRLAGGIANK